MRLRVSGAVVVAALVLVATGCRSGGDDGPDVEAGEGLQIRAITDVGAPRECVAILPPSEGGVLCDATGITYVVEPTELTSGMVDHVEAGSGVGGSEWSVDVRLSPRGAKLFGELTARAADAVPPGNQIALVVDGEVKSAPVVAEVISDGEVQITGGFDQSRAEEFAGLVKP